MSDKNKDTRVSPDSNSKPKKKSKHKVDIPTIVFFTLITIGAIMLTIVLLKKPNSKLYSKTYGDNIETLIEVYNNGDIDMAVSIDDERTLQKGKYTFKGKQSKDSYDGEYEATFTEDGQAVNFSFVIDDETLTLNYEDGTVIEFKERN